MHREKTPQEDEAIAYKTAKQNEKHPDYVIRLLEPHYHSEAKTHNLLIIRMLAEAYMHKGLESAEYTTRALPLWKILRESSRKQLSPNYPDIVKILASLMICMGNKSDIRELLAQEALSIMKEHEKAFLFMGRHRRLDDSYLKSMRYKICMSAAIFNSAYGSLQTDIKIQITSFDRAKKYFITILKENPTDLAALLHYAKFIVVESRNNVQLALDLLLPHLARHGNIPSYNFALKQLYSMNNEAQNAAAYEKRYQDLCPLESKGPKDDLILLFDHPVRLKTLDKCTIPEKVQMAVLLANERKFDEAKSILYAVLKECPDYLKALETLVTFEASSSAKGDPTKALQLCNKILSLNDKSITALLLKANLMLKSEKANDADMAEAMRLFEKAFEYGCRDSLMIGKLLIFSITSYNYENIIKYSLEVASREPSPIIYFYIGFSYYQLDQFKEAHEAFRQVRIHDKYFEQNLVSFYLISCLFHLAQTPEDYKVCAKKISSHLARNKSDENKAEMDAMVERLTSLSIHVYQAQSDSIPAVENSDDSASTPSDHTPQVPEYVKVKIKEWLDSYSSENEKAMSDLCDNTSTEIEEKEEDLYPIGDPKLQIYGYIAKKDKIPSGLLKQYERTLNKGHLLSINAKTKAGSNQHGIEKLHDGRYAVKIDSDLRLLSTGTFFRKRADDTHKHKTIIRFEKIKPHSRINRP